MNAISFPVNPSLPREDDRPLWDVLLGVCGLPALFIAHKLDMFELIDRTRPTFAELCTALKLERRTAQILVSAASGMGFLKIVDGRYVLTPLSEDYLLKKSPVYFGYYWDLIIDNHQVFAFESLKNAILTNEPTAYGVDDIYKTHREESERTRQFTQAMHSISLAPAMAWSRKLDLSPYRQMLDIGGGSGAHALMAVGAAPSMKATVFDLATVCPVTEQFIAHYGLTDRVNAQPGDMWLDEYPAADFHFYSQVYHGWQPEKCRFLSSKSFDALDSGGRIAVHEILYDDADKTGPFPTAAMSMLMLGWGVGEQYSGDDIKGFLEEAGFVDVQVIPTFGYCSIVTGRKP